MFRVWGLGLLDFVLQMGSSLVGFPCGVLFIRLPDYVVDLKGVPDSETAQVCRDA